MIKPYHITYKFYYNEELKGIHTSLQLRESPYEAEYSGTDFDGLWDIATKWSIMIPLSRWEFKKNQRFLQHYDWWFKKITPNNCKPWKFVITSREVAVSMEQLMRFDTKLVIQYLKEHGITTCPIVK